MSDSVPIFDYFNRTFHINTSFNRCPHLKVKIIHEEVEGLADTGASISVISSVPLIERLGLKINPINLKVSTADGTAYQCLGYVNVPYTFQSTTYVIPTVVVPEVSKDLILGMDFLGKFGFQLLIPGGINPKVDSLNVNSPEVNSKDFSLNIIEGYFELTDTEVCLEISPALSIKDSPVPQPEVDESLEMPTIEIPDRIIEHPDDIITEHELTELQRVELFKAITHLPATKEGLLGRTDLIEHSIELLPGAKPQKFPSYRWSPVVERVIDAEVERMIRLGVVEECAGPVDFLNPLLPIKKSNGKWRICLDSRRLNQCTKRDDFPFPNMVGILQRIQQSRYFSVIDLSESYYQVGLDSSSKDKTAFRTNKGLFRFTVMPFGLTNAPATMARLMAKVIGYDLEPWVYVYLDDIIITSISFEHHLQLIQEVAKRLQQAGLTINLLKSKFCQRRIRYLGYVLSEEGLSVDASKIQPVLDYPIPKTIKDIRRLLGLAGFYQKFIRNYSEITTPITNLLKKNRKVFTWTEEANEALNKLKSALVTAPVLGNPNFSLPFIIETDSSDLAIGAVLVQMQNGVRKCIAYFSKKLSSTQRKYSATERECLAVLLSIENFRHFVEGSQFIVQTDAMSLTFLRTMSIESKSPRIARWALKLSKYDLILQYKKGCDNIPADALSRSVLTVDCTFSDAFTAQLKRQIEENPGAYKDFRVCDGKVFKYITNSSLFDDVNSRWKYVVPVAERKEIVRSIHQEAHLGFLKTLAKVREKFYWPRMSTDVKRFCYSCDICKESKTPNQNVTPECGKPKLCSRPWELISMDFLGPYPRSKHGNVWLLVVTDFFTKFVMVQCMKSATAPGVCAFTEGNIFTLFGAPSICITDNAKVFHSDQFKRLLDRYGVTHWNLSVYHPSPNPTERVNRVIVTAIRCALNKESDHKHWDESVHQIARAIRTAVHDSTGYTPYFLNFGRNMVSSGREYEHLRNLGDPNQEMGFPLQDDQKKLFELVRENLLKAYQRYATPYNLRANRKHTFRAGEIVFKKNVNLSDKSKHFVGKFGQKFTKVRVREVIGTNTYVLEDLNGTRISGTYHGSFLKRS